MAGVVVAQALPSASVEVDEGHLDAMVRAYRATLVDVLTAAREAQTAMRIRGEALCEVERCQG